MDQNRDEDHDGRDDPEDHDGHDDPQDHNGCDDHGDHDNSEDQNKRPDIVNFNFWAAAKNKRATILSLASLRFRNGKGTKSVLIVPEDGRSVKGLPDHKYLS